MKTVEPDRFRTVMGHFATGVAVVTVDAPGGPQGMTANAVASLSLDPVLVLVCFDNGARTLPEVRRSGRFGVNVLADDQEHLARRFASKDEAKFAEIAHSVHDGIPVLDGALAWVGCSLERLVPGGDHTIGIGVVHAAELGPPGREPLIWFRGEYGSLGFG
jgi:3-hydroxy-9,10-secoandrosta-1,3,5(10)-triene-9,17-dione monooxygenase reductase component